MLVWMVLSSLEHRTKHSQERNTKQKGRDDLYAPVFHPQPRLVLKGHTNETVDLSWSRKFLLSCSMDGTVRLYRMVYDRCLWTITHIEPITSIAIHDRFFLAGSLGVALELWSIPDNDIVYSNRLADAITAVVLSPGGDPIIVGCLSGSCSFYKTEGLGLEKQLSVVPSRNGPYKITGIQTKSSLRDTSDKYATILVTSVDSCTRIFDLQTKSLEATLEVHQVISHQIRARPSDNGMFVVCGSEDKIVSIWPIGARPPVTREEMPHEYFHAHSSAVTQAIFVPVA